MADSIGLNGMEGHVYKGTSPGTSLTHAFRPGDIFGAGIIASKSMVFFTYAPKLPSSSIIRTMSKLLIQLGSRHAHCR